MPLIEFREKKVLKFVNIISKKIPEKELLSQDKQIRMLMNWIQAKSYEIVGPLVMYSSGITGIDSEGTPITESRIMVQIKQDNVKYEIPYYFEKEIRIENCLLARFNGNAEKLQFATTL